jgi:pimeloyl-ACP methyl ester carboxylesterase
VKLGAVRDERDRVPPRECGHHRVLHRWPPLAACLLAGLVLAACTVGPSQRPAVAVRGEGPVVAPSEQAPAAAPGVPPLLLPARPSRELDFAPCSPTQVARIGNPSTPDRTLSYECTELRVDSVANGTGGVEQMSVGLVRIGLAGATGGAAGAPGPRAPIVVLGESDGVPSSTLAAQIAATMPLPALQKVQLVGLDRRGTVVDRLDCSPDPARIAIVDFNAHGAGAADLDALLEQSRMVVQDCYARLPEVLGSFSTASTVTDLERVRQLLGVARLPVISRGDGARAVASWAERSPGSVGRLILDTPPDPTLDEVASARAGAAAAESAFEAFAKDCTTRGGCPLGANPRQAVRGLVDRLGPQPLTGASGRQLTSGALLWALRRGLDEPVGWPALARSLAAAGNGDPAGMLTLLDPVLGPDGNFDVALATHCNDTTQRVAPTQALELIQRWGAELPLFGPPAAARLLLCGPWPVPAERAPSGPAAEAPPLLVLGTAGDPRTPLDGAQRASASLSSARFVSWLGSGHGAYPRTACVADAVHALMIDGTPPGANVLCPP